MKRVYLLDGIEIDWKDLIRKGKEAGMDQSSRILSTSAAAEALRKMGHTVTQEEVEE